MSKRSYICYYVICMTVTLSLWVGYITTWFQRYQIVTPAQPISA